MAEDSTAKRTRETITEKCPRCNGKGKKEPTLVAGKFVGGDTEYLCYRCRGTGVVSYIKF